MIFRRPPSMQTFIPKINGGVPTRALGDALDREAVRRATEMLQAAPPPKSKTTHKPPEGK